MLLTIVPGSQFVTHACDRFVTIIRAFVYLAEQQHAMRLVCGVSRGIYKLGLEIEQCDWLKLGTISGGFFSIVFITLDIILIRIQRHGDTVLLVNT